MSNNMNNTNNTNNKSNKFESIDRFNFPVIGEKKKGAKVNLAFAGQDMIQELPEQFDGPKFVSDQVCKFDDSKFGCNNYAHGTCGFKHTKEKPSTCYYAETGTCHRQNCPGDAKRGVIKNIEGKVINIARRDGDIAESVEVEKETCGRRVCNIFFCHKTKIHINCEAPKYCTFCDKGTCRDKDCPFKTGKAICKYWTTCSVVGCKKIHSPARITPSSSWNGVSETKKGKKSKKGSKKGSANPVKSTNAFDILKN